MQERVETRHPPACCLMATLEGFMTDGMLAEGFPLSMGPWSFDQLEFLFVLCALYLVAVMTSGALKFAINVAKGRVGERVLRHGDVGPRRR